MADHSEDVPSAPSPVYQLPEWETITHPPKPRQSLLGRILPSKNPTDEPPLDMSTRASPSTPAGIDRAKEPSDRASTLPLQTSPITENSSGKPTLATSFRTRLDSVLPPHRTYCRRSRRFLFLYILLPMAIFLFVLVPLAIGLGVGLSRRSRTTK
ncbi:hypothetical protein F4781DRAFT_247921 [Annulohypoxylon bovei var. microspora]|nr:hypothetical protein F4781DRAFT_247921 [Annulohypoxylon bovei var. microspora]